jgi:hypothetical protein
MRNILEYPLNAEDVISTLESAQEDYEKKQLIGGMNGLVLSQLLAFFNDEVNMKNFLESTSIKE